MIIHIIPVNDLKPHEEEGTACKCEPRVEFLEGGMLVIHNAYDNREIIEKVNDLLNPKNYDNNNKHWRNSRE